MKKVIILGAGGNIARLVTSLLEKREDIALTLFLRTKKKLGTAVPVSATIVEGDVLKYDQLSAAIRGQDIVYVNLAGDLEPMAKNIVKAMDETAVKTIIFISSIGIYEAPLKATLVSYRKSADLIERSGLDYTILRPAWFTDADEVDYETTKKDETERGSVISKKSLATLIVKIIDKPEKFTRQSLGVNKPGK